MAKYTERIIEEALRGLMHEKKVDNITVDDITERAQINRKTFYYHYHSISDLIIKMCTVQIAAIIGDEQITTETWTELLRKILNFIVVEQNDMKAVLISRYANEYTIHFTHLAEYATSAFIEDAIKRFEKNNNTVLNITKKQQTFIKEYYSMAVFGFLKIWFSSGLKDSPEDVIHMLNILTNDNIYSAFRLIDAENTCAHLAQTIKN